MAATGAVTAESILKGIDKVVPDERAALRKLNAAAFQRGYDTVAAVGA